MMLKADLVAAEHARTPIDERPVLGPQAARRRELRRRQLVPVHLALGSHRPSPSRFSGRPRTTRPRPLGREVVDALRPTAAISASTSSTLTTHRRVRAAYGDDTSKQLTETKAKYDPRQRVPQREHPAVP